MIDANDDLATAKAPYNVVACVPVHGRLPLMKHTIERLYKKNGCYKVICAGDGLEEKKLCESLGAVWVHASNKPLGAKWNKAFMKAKDFNPDACLFVGSSDWLCDDWINLTKPYADQYHFTGTPGCYFLDINTKLRLVHWTGYIGPRSNESIGIGRILSRDLMNKINWKPFHEDKDGSLDRSMKDNCKKFGIDDYLITDERLKAVSISTSIWENKHQFEQHWTGLLPSKKINEVDNFVETYFPEIRKLKNDLCSVTSVKV